MLDLTVLIPAIRTDRWENVVKSLNNAVTRYKFEILFAGPFNPSPDLQINYPNVRFIRTYEKIPVVIQKATVLARGKLIFHTTDDSIFFPESLDKCVDSWEEIYKKTMDDRHVINCRYREGYNHNGYPLPMNFWTAGFHSDLNFRGIDPDWHICVQPMMSRRYFIELGGFNCIFEYSNHCHHDFMFRLQRDGGKIYDSPVEVANASHMPGKTGDHGPIHDAQTLYDAPIFRDMYEKGNVPVIIKYENYEDYEGVWSRRFPKMYETYDEMINAYQNENQQQRQQDSNIRKPVGV